MSLLIRRLLSLGIALLLVLPPAGAAPAHACGTERGAAIGAVAHAEDATATGTAGSALSSGCQVEKNACHGPCGASCVACASCVSLTSLPPAPVGSSSAVWYAVSTAGSYTLVLPVATPPPRVSLG